LTTNQQFLIENGNTKLSKCRRMFFVNLKKLIDAHYEVHTFEIKSSTTPTSKYNK